MPVVVTKDGAAEDKEEETPVLEPIPHLAPISTATVIEPVDNAESITSETRPRADRMATASETVTRDREDATSPGTEEVGKETPLATEGSKDLESSELSQHKEGVNDHAAPPPAVMDEPSKLKEEPTTASKSQVHDSGKLSSWFKNKFSRHSGDKDKDKDKKGGKALNAALGPHEPLPETMAHDASKTSTTADDDDDLYTASVDGATDHHEEATTTAGGHPALSSHPPTAIRTSHSRSTSISSLSSDEPTTSRGRTPMRSPPLAEPLSPTPLGDGKTLVSGLMGHPIAVIDDTVNHEDSVHLKPPGLLEPFAEGTDTDTGTGTGTGTGTLARTSTSGETEEFEEAKDYFEEGPGPGEVLEKPKPGFAAKERPAGSPVRDSRFVENL